MSLEAHSLPLLSSLASSSLSFLLSLTSSLKNRLTRTSNGHAPAVMSSRTGSCPLPRCRMRGLPLREGESRGPALLCL